MHRARVILTPVTMRLHSVNRAAPGWVRLGDRDFFTAIEKTPAPGPILVGTLGLEGDGVGSPQHHGGRDQAVYVYGLDDYRWWEAELGQRLAPGSFGENLTIEGLRSQDLAIGDHLEIGDAVTIEISAPRIPCGTLAARMMDGGFVKKFRVAQRPGAYARVIELGIVEAGDAVQLVPAANRTLALLDMFNLFYDRSASPETYARALEAPIAERARIEYQRLAGG